MEYYRLHLPLLVLFSNSDHLLWLGSRSIGNPVISSQNSASLSSVGPDSPFPTYIKHTRDLARKRIWDQALAACRA